MHLIILTALIPLITAHSGWSETNESVALSIRLDQPVRLDKSSGDPSIFAYRAFDNCKSWYYIPTRQIATGLFRHRVSLSQQTYDNKSEAVLFNSIELQSDPELTAADLDKLRAQIVLDVASKAICGGQKIRPEDIALSPAPVKIVDDIKLGESKKGSYQEVAETFTSGSDSYISAGDSLSITYLTDATEAASHRRLEQKVKESNARDVEFGKLTYQIKGITAQVSASMEVEINSTRVFRDAIERMHCDSKHGSTGGTIGKLGFDVKTSTKTCHSQILAQLEKEKIVGVAQYNFGGFNFGPAGHEVQILQKGENGQPVSMPFQQFIQEELLELWAQTYMGSVLEGSNTRAGQNNLLKQGEVTSSTKLTAKFDRSFFNNLALQVTVAGRKLNGEFDEKSVLSEAVAQCGIKSHQNQALLFEKYMSLKPIPILKSCLTTPDPGN